MMNSKMMLRVAVVERSEPTERWGLTSFDPSHTY
jgi:hypothetical protein